MLTNGFGNCTWRRRVLATNTISTRPTNCGANNQLAQLACQLALPKLNRSNVMIMSNRKPNVWLVTLDTNWPHVLRRVGYWGELAVGELTVA